MAARQSDGGEEIPTSRQPFTAASRSWTAFLAAAIIVTYFSITTVVLPSMVIESGFLASTPSWYEDLISASSWSTVRDLIGTGVWFVALIFGMWALRRAQRSQLI